MTLTMDRVQARYGKPPREVILNLYRKHAEAQAIARAVANELGIAPATLWNWRAKLGISDEQVRMAILEGEGQRPVQPSRSRKRGESP